MEIYILYAIYFIIGILLGSFFSLAVYRIPKRENITHKASYCPKCNHKLGFFDLIPVLSYLFLKGKCKYCKSSIRPRYLILEVCSGIVFLLFAISLNIDIYNINIQKIVYLIFGTLFISTLFIIGGIDKEEHNISKDVLLFGLITEVIYIIYLYILGKNIYGYVIYLLAIAVLLLIETLYLKKKGKAIYPVQIITLCIYLVIWAKENNLVLSVILAIWVMIINQITYNSKKDIITRQNEPINISIGAYLCFSSIAVLIVENLL